MHVDDKYLESVYAAIQRLMKALDAVFPAPVPRIPGIGFERGRNSGVLFGSIPSLAIKGPAILLAPRAIAQWSEGLDSLNSMSLRIDSEAMRTWFGISDLAQRPAAVAIVNVLHHELTHAMLALPNDPVQHPRTLFCQRWAFYDEFPDFEEGLCDATAAVATGIQLLKAQFDISGRTIPRLDRGKYEPRWREVHAALRESYVSYFGEATDRWMAALRHNNDDFGGLAGLVKLYSTNFAGIDWTASYMALSDGRITTGAGS